MAHTIFCSSELLYHIRHDQAPMLSTLVRIRRSIFMASEILAKAFAKGKVLIMGERPRFRGIAIGTCIEKISFTCKDVICDACPCPWGSGMLDRTIGRDITYPHTVWQTRILSNGNEQPPTLVPHSPRSGEADGQSSSILL